MPDQNFGSWRDTLCLQHGFPGLHYRSFIISMFIQINPSSSLILLPWDRMWKTAQLQFYMASFNNFDAVLTVSFDTAILHSRGLWRLQGEYSSQTLVSCNFSCVKTDHLYCCYPSINMPVILTLVMSVLTVSVGNSNPRKHSSVFSLVMCNRLILYKLFIYTCTCTCTCIYSAILGL
jgi:hypothetical protein